MSEKTKNMTRPRVGDLEIDTEIGKLEKMDWLANDLFERRITPQEYREQLTSVILTLTATGLQMFAATYVQSEEDFDNFYQNLEQEGRARTS
jgi:hypothetical protein